MLCFIWGIPLFLFVVIGYAIFRGSNSQKDRFRTDPNSDEFQGNNTKYKGENKYIIHVVHMYFFKVGPFSKNIKATKAQHFRNLFLVASASGQPEASCRMSEKKKTSGTQGTSVYVYMANHRHYTDCCRASSAVWNLSGRISVGGAIDCMPRYVSPVKPIE